MTIQEEDIFYAQNRHEWRDWLMKNHATKQSVWLKGFKKQSGKNSVSWSESVDEALCFGWIDSTRKTIDAECYIQYFTKRKPGSVWSKINKEKIENLTAQKRMMPAGEKCVEIAKQNGMWNIMDEVEELLIPDDLEQAFQKHPGAKAYFESLSKSIKKMMLHWVVMAKRTETRQNRIEEIAIQAAQQRKPKQF